MKRPLFNILSLSLSDIGSRFIGFLITVYLARILEPSAFGILNIGLAVLGYLLLVASPGIQILETRNVAATAEVDPSRVNAVLSMRLVLACLLCVAVWVVSGIFVRSNETRDVIVYFSVSLIPLALMLDWFFQGRERFDLVGLSKLAQYLGYGTFVMILVHTAGDVRFAAVAFWLGNVAAALLMILFYQKHVGGIQLKWQLREWKRILGDNLPVGGAMFLGQTAINLPPIVIGLLLTASDVGVYSAAMKLVFLLLILDRLVNALFLPVATRYFRSRPQDVPFLLGISLKAVIASVFPLAAFGVIVAPWATELVFGQGYREASALLQVLMGYFFLTLVNSVFVCLLIGGGRERRYTFTVLIGAAWFAIAIVVLTRTGGLLGAAWGVALGELGTVLLMFFEVRKFVDFPIFKTVGRILVPCVLMGASVWLLRDLTMPVQVAVSASVFTASLIAVGGLAKEEIRFLKERFV